LLNPQKKAIFDGLILKFTLDKYKACKTAPEKNECKYADQIRDYSMTMRAVHKYFDKTAEQRAEYDSFYKGVEMKAFEDIKAGLVRPADAPRVYKGTEKPELNYSDRARSYWSYSETGFSTSPLLCFEDAKGKRPSCQNRLSKFTSMCCGKVILPK